MEEKELVPLALKRVRGSQTAILVKMGTKNAQIIEMDQNGLSVAEISISRLWSDWDPLLVDGVEYPTHRAAASYLSFGNQYLGMTTRAYQSLKEIIMQYVVEKAGQVLSAHANKTAASNSLKTLDPDLQERCKLVGSASDLEELSLVNLLALYNNVVGEDAALKKFTDRGKDALRTWNAMEAVHNPKVQAANERAATKAEKAPKSGGKKDSAGGGGARAGSKTDLLIGEITKGATLEQICEASGFDGPNARTTIGILRSRKGLVINLNKETGIYKLAS